jgi:hypothetical protein
MMSNGPNLFVTSFFLGNQGPWENEVNGERHEAKDRVHHVAKKLACVVGPTFCLMGQDAANFGLTKSSLPKTDYICPLWRFRKGVAEKHKIHNMDLQTARIGGETLSEPLPVAPSTPLTPSPLAPRWRYSSSPPELWGYGSNLYQTLYHASMIRVAWVAYYDYDHICITPMVDILFMIWSMRCKDVFIFDVWVDVYVTPFLCACSDQTTLLGLCEGYVCISWSNLAVSLGFWEVTKIPELLCFLPFYDWLTRENGLPWIKPPVT